MFIIIVGLEYLDLQELGCKNLVLLLLELLSKLPTFRSHFDVVRYNRCAPDFRHIIIISCFISQVLRWRQHHLRVWYQFGSALGQRSQVRLSVLRSTVPNGCHVWQSALTALIATVVVAIMISAQETSCLFQTRPLFTSSDRTAIMILLLLLLCFLSANPIRSILNNARSYFNFIIRYRIYQYRIK